MLTDNSCRQESGEREGEDREPIVPADKITVVCASQAGKGFLLFQALWGRSAAAVAAVVALADGGDVLKT